MSAKRWVYCPQCLSDHDGEFADGETLECGACEALLIVCVEGDEAHAVLADPPKPVSDLDDDMERDHDAAMRPTPEPSHG